jgi:hypothetical protein
MYQTFNLQSPTDKLLEHLQTSFNKTGIGFRRRAVIAPPLNGGEWMLILCTIEAFPNSKQAPEACAPRRYPRRSSTRIGLVGKIVASLSMMFKRVR